MFKKLIIALDFDNAQQAWHLINQLDPALCALKIGSEMFTRLGVDFVTQLVRQQFFIFLDLKFHDIPNTVAKACLAAAQLGVQMINVHASGGMAMMQAAKASLAGCTHPPLLIAVTVLTSMSGKNLQDIGISNALDKHVLHLTQMAFDAKLDGVVCAAAEVPAIKARFGESFLTITPGIRLAEDAKQDQCRIATPKQAVAYGSDYLVMGRSITQSPTPHTTLQTILQSLTS